MSSRGDIIDGNQATGSRKGLIYTKQCGWVDLGHVRPDGANGLWQELKLHNYGIGKENHKLQYSQWMQKRGVRVGITKRYAIKKGLNRSEMKSIGSFNIYGCLWRV